MELIGRRDFFAERALRKKGPAFPRHVIAKLAGPDAIVVQAAVLAAAAVRRHPRAAACILGAPLLAIAAANVAKALVARPRPLSHLLRRKGFESFPSSHTAGKSALVWTVAIVFPARARTRAMLAAAASLDVLVVAAARVGDGAHWPTDTVGGAVLGLAAAQLVTRIIPSRRRTPRA